MRGGTGAGAAMVVALILAGCGDQSSPSPPAPAAPTAVTPALAGSAEKGRQVWLGQCIVCHNTDPSKDGPLGPAVKGASRELVEARVVRAEYPPDYAPKRPSKIMPARPDLAPSVPDLAAYLH